jgi:AcrR family transcriptional regulator
VAAAEAVLLREGPAGITVRAVASEAGVAPMGVYNRFGNKQGLVDLLLIRGFDQLREAVSGRGEIDALERLRGSGERYRRFALDHPQRYDLMFGMGRRWADTAPEVSEHAAAAFGELVGHASYAMATGAVPSGDAFELAQQIWCCVHGAVALEVSGQFKTPDPAATYTRLLALLARGSAASPPESVPESAPPAPAEG